MYNFEIMQYLVCHNVSYYVEKVEITGLVLHSQLHPPECMWIFYGLHHSKVNTV